VLEVLDEAPGLCHWRGGVVDGAKRWEYVEMGLTFRFAVRGRLRFGIWENRVSWRK